MLQTMTMGGDVPYRLVSRQSKSDDTLISLGTHAIGRDFTLISGLCSVESEAVTLRHAAYVAEQGAPLFRAGLFKPRTNPYSFQGLGEEGIPILQKVKDSYPLQIVTEVLLPEHIDLLRDVADIFQVGARNMANTPLLKALGRQPKPVLLKRGMAATLEEFLLAAEYIVSEGNQQVILCERGIKTFNTHCRYTLDVAAIAALRQLTHLPVIADPSHAAGEASLVSALAGAAVAAGAQGLLIEIHDTPETAMSDGRQAIHPDTLASLMTSPVLRGALA